MTADKQDSVLLQLKNIQKSFDTRVSLVNRLKGQEQLKV